MSTPNAPAPESSRRPSVTGAWVVLLALLSAACASASTTTFDPLSTNEPSRTLPGQSTDTPSAPPSPDADFVLIDLNPDYLKQQMDRNRDIPLGLETA